MARTMVDAGWTRRLGDRGGCYCVLLMLSMLRHAQEAGSVLSRPDMTAEQRLVADLLSDYHRHGRPTADPSLPLRVELSFHMTQLQRMEERDQILSVTGFLRTTWRDDFLRWNVSQYGGLQRIVLPPKLVWMPDFGIENSVRAIYGEMFFKRFHVSVTSEGQVVWTPGGKFVVSCELDITYYPFDDQICFLDFVDWAYHGLQVDLHNGSDGIGLDTYRQSGEWDVRQTKAERMLLIHDDVPFPRIRFSMLLRRKPLFYMLNILLPCTTTTFLAVLSFYLPADSAQKVNLGVSVLLSFSVFLILVAENVPKTSEFVPLIVIFITLVMAITAASIVICVSVLNVHYRDPTRAVPEWLRRLAFRLLAPLVCQLSQTRVLCADDTQVVECDCKPGICKLDRVGTPKNRPRILDGLQTTSALHLAEILERLRELRDIVQDNEEDSICKREWKLVARIFDRFFLGLFSLTVIGSLFVLLFAIPQFVKEPKIL